MKSPDFHCNPDHTVDFSLQNGQAEIFDKNDVLQFYYNERGSVW